MKKRDTILIVLINIFATITSIAFLVYGKFKSNYGLEYIGLQIAVLSLILLKREKDTTLFGLKLKKICYVFLGVNGVLDIVFIMNSVINYPKFFWWQNFQ